jgi:type-F conjugative transfer system mating-pair stabilization protein TraN
MPRIKFLLTTIVFLSINCYPAFSEEVCQTTGETCVEGGATRNIGEQPVYKPCWKYQKTYHCYQPEVDYCTPLKTAGCEQLNSVCTATDILDGGCNNYQNTYRCGSLLGTPDPNITLLASTYIITNDYLDYSKCEGRDALPNCSITDSICKQPAETRNINGKDVYKSCWQFENTYSCKIGDGINNCINIPDYCQYKDSQCLAQTGDLCVHTQNTYLCSQSQVIAPEQMQCGSNVYCLNGQCQKVEDDSPNEFFKAVGYLQAINQSKDNNGDAGNLKIFSGNAKGCSIKVGGYNNCCKDNGWGQSIGASCSAEETSLAELQSKKQCHYVGSYCSDEKPFGICLETTKTSCCFNSKISRVIVEQGRSHLGISWGSAKAPNCGGFTPEQLQSLKFDQMDLSEISADIANSVAVPNTQYLEDKAKDSIGRLSNTTTSTSP